MKKRVSLRKIRFFSLFLRFASFWFCSRGFRRNLDFFGKKIGGTPNPQFKKVGVTPNSDQVPQHFLPKSQDFVAPSPSLKHKTPKIGKSEEKCQKIGFSLVKPVFSVIMVDLGKGGFLHRRGRGGEILYHP